MQYLRPITIVIKYFLKEHNQSQTSSRLMLFDLALGGHHGIYIQHLIKNWYENKQVDSIYVVVLPDFLEIHLDVIDFFNRCNDPRLQLVPITQEEANLLATRESGVNRLLRNVQEWKLFCRYGKLLKATKALFMYLDTCEIPLFFRLKAPCPFSGIYFRPTFHYGDWETVSPSLKNKVQRQRNKLTLNRILNHPQLDKLFCLDPFAVEQLNQANKTTKVIYLPDPVSLNNNSNIQSQDLRKQIGIEPNRKVFLLFGALNERKGIYKLLEAIELLSLELCKKLCLVLVGGTNTLEEAKIHSRVEELCRTLPLQVIERYEFISEDLVPTYLQLTDVVLAPYQKHIGMSGILLLAAAAGKPVLSSNYGLMGELVRRYQLGLVVDSTIATELAKTLSLYLSELPETFCDRSKMKLFAQQNDAKKFAKVIFQNLPI